MSAPAVNIPAPARLPSVQAYSAARTVTVSLPQSEQDQPYTTQVKKHDKDQESYKILALNLPATPTHSSQNPFNSHPTKRTECVSVAGAQVMRKFSHNIPRNLTFHREV